MSSEYATSSSVNNPFSSPPMVNSTTEANGSLNSSTVVIYLQSRDRRDDYLKINRQKCGGFKATFVNHTIGRVFVQYFEDEEAVIRYIDTFIMIQQVDVCPYAFIQVDLPGLPSIIMNPSVRDWDRIFNMVKSYFRDIAVDCHQWPREYTISAYNNAMANNTH